ncbi:MAG TPA: hypothetical protein VFF63_04990 [Candidatus Babeliales bacterium]|nr:hypothetical protein [Candidatus Babeliales bacterium]
MRVGIRTLVWLALCAAAAGAALAHFAIDVVGDYALARDSYDSLPHSSRDFVSGAAFVLAVVLLARGLRVCCEIAVRNRAKLARPAIRLRDALGLFAGVIGASAAIVPAMEYLDGRLDGVPVQRLADAFGGSIPLGLSTTVVCTGIVTLLVYAVARWLISYRDSIVTVIETLVRRAGDDGPPDDYAALARSCAPLRRRTPRTRCLSKRGPPATNFA